MNQPVPLTPRPRPTFDWAGALPPHKRLPRTVSPRLIGLGAALALLCALYLGPLNADAVAVVAS